MAFASFEALLEGCQAVAFAVPPAVQAELAAVAARAGKAVLLDKPIAETVEGAQRLSDAVGEAGVASQVLLTWRYTPAVRGFLEQSATLEAFGGRGLFVSGGLLGGIFATPWRLREGPLLDLGPHVIDLLDAALGPVVSVRAHGDRLGWVGLLLEHDGGALSEASLCATAAVEPARAGIEVFGPRGALAVDCTAAVGPDAFATVSTEFADTVRGGGGHPLDVERGLHLQKLIGAAGAGLRVGTPRGDGGE